MPLYEYQCTACCRSFEHLVLRADDPAPVCPHCTCVKVEKRMSASAVRAQGIPTGAGGFQAPACQPSGG